MLNHGEFMLPRELGDGDEIHELEAHPFQIVLEVVEGPGCTVPASPSGSYSDGLGPDEGVPPLKVFTLRMGSRNLFAVFPEGPCSGSE